MHPPFGFALFYLRSVAPREAYQDKVTGRLMPPVKTSDIYWGAVPFVGIQLVMVGLLMVMPALVMSKPEVRHAPPAAATSPATRPQPTGLPIEGGFALDPTPPRIEGSPDTPWSGPVAPTLDLRELPSLTAPERALPTSPLHTPPAASP
jgi:hypothetical protein